MTHFKECLEFWQNANAIFFHLIGELDRWFDCVEVGMEGVELVRSIVAKTFDST